MKRLCPAASSAFFSRAFTLLELVVVMAVIALLATLVLPSLTGVKTRAQGLSCLNNLRQWGSATHAFAVDHDDLLPKDGAPNGASLREGWYVDLPRILGLPPYAEMPWRTNAAFEPGRSVWICPTNRRRSNGFNLFHYCLNQHINKAGSGNQIRLSSIRRPATAIWLFDNGKAAAVAQQNNVHKDLHRSGAHFLFLDGHVARFNSSDCWDFTSDRGRTNHPALQWFP